MPRVAESLEVLRKQINALFPSRDKSSDGGIGDEAHRSRPSDHNPNKEGVVCARDFTNDPAHGLSSQALAEALVASKDERIKYVISNRRICSGSQQKEQAWVWRPYSGSNPHNHHCHISVKAEKKHYDDVSPWKLKIQAPLPNVAPTPVFDLPLLRRGSSGPVVLRLQELLNAKGGRLDLDGSFGPGTERAVKQFQEAHQLVADGVVGRYTWDALRGE